MNELSYFRDMYETTYGEPCGLTDDAILFALKNHPQYGKFFQAGTAEQVEACIMRWLPDILDYIHYVQSQKDSAPAEKNQDEVTAYAKFRLNYLNKYGANCSLTDDALYYAFCNHNPLGQEFATLHGKDIQDFLISHETTMLQYIYSIAAKPVERDGYYATFRTVYREAYKEECKLTNEELFNVFLLHELGPELMKLSSSRDLSQQFIAQHMTALIEHVHATGGRR